MATLRNYSQIVWQNGSRMRRFPANVASPLFEKTVGNRIEEREFVIGTGRDEIETIWEFDQTDAVFDFFAFYNDSGAGVVNVALEIVKPTSASDFTPDGAWATFVSTFQVSCGELFQLATPYAEIASTRNNMGALSGSDPQPLASADGAVTTGYIRKIKVSNPGTAEVRIKTLCIWSDE